MTMHLWSRSVSVREEWAGSISDLLGRRISLRSASFNRAGLLEYTSFICHFLFILVYCGLILLFKLVNVGWILILRTYNRYYKWQMNRQLGRMAFIPTADPPPSCPAPGTVASAAAASAVTSAVTPADASAAATLTGPFFTRLPAEVRRKILIFAYGGRTLHMDMSLRTTPWQTPSNIDEWRSIYPPAGSDVSWHHAAILTKNFDGRSPPPPRRRRLLLVHGRRKWRWFSCVCHRYPPRGPDHLPLGRRSNYPWNRLYEPSEDLCLKGGGCCGGWFGSGAGGEWPGACLIGISGFLYSCRQAYIEGMDVLYRTNTIHIASAVLLRRFQDILSPRIVSSITSLELVWNTRVLPFEDGFTGTPCKSTQPKRQYETPVFPALQYLRISFATIQWPRLVDMSDTNHATGLPFNEADRTKVADRLHSYTLPTIDALLDRIAPAATEVTVSCPSWEWYGRIDLWLVETQGLEKTRLCRSEMEGLKCWRVVPRSEAGGECTAAASEVGGGGGDTAKITVEALEEGRGPKKLREGYWIHIPIYQVALYGHSQILSSYDQERHDMYGLGPERYGFK